MGAIASYEDTVAALDEPLPAHGEDPVAVIERLASVAGPATVASPGPRYFGFVTGGALPAALAADWLDVGVGPERLHPRRARRPPPRSRPSPSAGCWRRSGLPADAAVGFATGATMSNFTGLAAARHAVLARAGWDVEADGLIGAPADPRARRRAGPRVAPRRAALRRLRRRRAERIAGRRPGRDARRRAARRSPRRRARRSSAPRQARSTPAPSTRSRRSPTRRTSTAPGCTSTARSACGRPRARGCGTWCAAPSAPTRGRSTRTSG